MLSAASLAIENWGNCISMGSRPSVEAQELGLTGPDWPEACGTQCGIIYN